MSTEDVGLLKNFQALIPLALTAVYSPRFVHL